jgi:preprotein translocase subunit SecB
MLASQNHMQGNLPNTKEHPAMAKAAKKAAAKKAEPNSESNGAGSDPSAAPSMKILGQYIKDLSFENPNAPQSLAGQDGQPEINISVNVNAKPMSETDFEVELHLNAKAQAKDSVVFAAELLYAGIFRLENIPQDALHPIVLVECPRMLFPFARQIIADVSRNGGFPPLMLDPIDFAAMYQQRVAAGQPAQQA